MLRDADPGTRWKLAAGLAVAVLAVVMFATARDYGTVWDEEVQFLYGEYVLRWFSSGFTDRAALSFGDLHLYGGLFDVVANLAVHRSPLGIYETRHLVTVAFGLLAVVATWRIGLLVAGPATGLLSAILLALTPVFYGHAFVNPKDIPFAALAAVALYYVFRSAREAPCVPLALCVKTGVAVGAALGIRVGGVFLLGYLGLAWTSRIVLAPAAESAGRGSWWRAAATLAGRFGVVAALSWAVMLVFWPWAQESPLARPIEALSAATRFRWDGPVLFDGRIVSSLHVPRGYLPTWFAVTLPEAYFVALAAGALALITLLVRRRPARREAVLEAGLLAFTVLFPFAVVQLLRPVLYDAQRQFLFVLPPLAVLAAWGLVALLREPAIPAGIRWGLAVAGCASAVLTIVDMVQLHPYESIFFNRLVAGGLPGAAGRYETDYWGSSYREGVEDVIRGYRPNGAWPVKVANCAVPFLTDYWLSRHPEARGRFVTVRADQDPDLLIATTRYRCLVDMGRPIHVVARQETPLLVVFERHPRGEWATP